jgi:hypothetical protein
MIFFGFNFEVLFITVGPNETNTLLSETVRVRLNKVY